MTLTQLFYVVSVAMYKSFSKAAEKCFVTQPTLSMQINKLEEELGVKIFNRQITPIEPTDIGNEIIEQARIILEESERINDIVYSFGKEIYGRLRIGIIPTVSPYLLPLFLESYLSKYPKVELVISELQTKEIIQQLEHNTIDAGIIAGPWGHTRFIEENLYHEPFLAYVSQGHRLSARKKIRSDDLSLEDLWLLKEGHCFRDQILNICGTSKGNRKGKNLIHLNFEGENLETLKGLVDQNMGMTLLPYLAAEKLKGEPSDGLLKEFVAPVPSRQISMIYSKAKLKHRLLVLLMEEIRNSVPSGLKREKFITIEPIFNG
jgi:LysR family hydrogen peroxide-inducible transcriptional activator